MMGVGNALRLTVGVILTLLKIMQATLNIRLPAQGRALFAKLQERTGLSKSEVVRKALQVFAGQALTEETSLYSLGADTFGRCGDATRQAADIKHIVKARLAAKRAR